MAKQSPIFPMPEPQHFSDYGFDPQFDYFQVLEEARKHKREKPRSIDALHFKLQKPISKDDSKKIKKTKKRWWRNALLFFRRKLTPNDRQPSSDHRDGLRCGRALRGSMSGPLYITESRGGSATPYRTTSQPTSGPLAGTLTPARKGEMGVPYISLRELNMEQQHRISASAMPIYLVT
ncbi:uncharacterized protein LOC132293891 [Cornus florida]|uniref:uncharacterized protein LOC132293891 n=1 Tax=Cornus florida TaxID=4283 RepID=UPI00289D67B6|nr:uncharacterized protein LOC132293891 [Cornus florida]